MKVKFEFDTESEGFSGAELEQYLQAPRTARCVAKIAGQLRNWDKYDERVSLYISEIYDTIFEIIKEEVDLERLGY